MPLLLSDGESSYLYGPGGLPVEQISSKEEPTYLHHDQLGSTRLLTGATGTGTASFSYAPYGGLEGRTGTATTPLGFAGQYTDAETGLQYLRARFYDPGTGQFLTRDPLGGLTRQPYFYALDNPSNRIDPSGLFGELIEGGCVAGEVADPAGGCVPGAATGAVGEVVRWGGSAAAGATSWVLSEISGEDEERSSEAKAGPCNTGDQDALIQLGKEARRKGVSEEDAEILKEWAEEHEVPFRGPEAHPGRGFGANPHIHVGPINHIPVR